VVTPVVTALADLHADQGGQRRNSRARPGGTISYTVTLVNLGPSTAQNVTLTDVLSAGLSRIGTASSNNGATTNVDARARPAWARRPAWRLGQTADPGRSTPR
jgi:uncharacterized repeat protein (TIGR01451 family)